MNEVLELGIVFIGLLTAVAMEFSPILISYLTGNWWFMFLFAITWIPSLIIIMLTSAFTD